MTPKEALITIGNFNPIDYQDITISQLFFEEYDMIYKSLLELKKLKKFKSTFDAYELATRQGYVAYEMIQEYHTAIDKITDKATHLRNKEDKTEFEKGILRGYHTALKTFGFIDDIEG
jgi:hypothetical protein